MATTSGATTPTSATDTGHFPAYGPIEALLGMVLFVSLVSHTTPAIVDVAAHILPDVPAETVRTALAIFIWFVVAVTLLDQLRRQLAALGLTTHTEVARESRGPGLLSQELALGYLVLFLLGVLFAGYTIDAAFGTVLALLDATATQNLAVLTPGAIATLIVFFVSYGLATRAIDRLVVGGLRLAFSE